EGYARRVSDGTTYAARSVTLSLPLNGREDTRSRAAPATQVPPLRAIEHGVRPLLALGPRDRTGRAGLRGPARPVSISAGVRAQPYPVLHGHDHVVAARAPGRARRGRRSRRVLGRNDNARSARPH